MTRKLTFNQAAKIMRAANLEPLEDYPGNKEKWKCKCLQCGKTVFPSLGSARKNGGGCKDCGIKLSADSRRNSEKDVVKIMKNAGALPLEPYSNSKKPWLCRCLKCKKDTKFNHSQMRYTTFCSSYACSKSTSKGEIELYNFIHSLNPNTKQKFYIGRTEYDIKCDNILFEYNGLYWHSEENQKDPKYHLKKKELANENGYRLIYVWEDDWQDKQEIIKSFIKNQLGFINKKIGARECEIKEIQNKEKELFLNQNHIQGNCQSSINIGLYYKDELVSLMTFGKKRMVLNSSSEKNEYELLRFCSKINYSIIGGANKLFNYFNEHYKINSITTYANMDMFTGDMYEKLGFKYINKTPISYWWANNKKRYHRSNFMKHKLVNEGYDKNKTEIEIMTDRGFNKVYGCGNLKYEYIK